MKLRVALAALALSVQAAVVFAQGAPDADFTVGDIRVEGLQRVSEGTVYNYLPVNIGDRLTAQRVREAIRADFARVFAQGVHALFTPTTPTPAFRFGENTADPLAMYLSDIFVCTANLAWVPALSLPIGRDQGLPIGGQLIGPVEGEGTIIRVAQALERATDPAAEVR